MSNNQLNEQKSEQFAERMLSILNHGALNLMISIGYRTGLFDAMSNLLPSVVMRLQRLLS